MMRSLLTRVVFFGTLAAVLLSGQPRRERERERIEEWNYEHGRIWDPSWNRRAAPSAGACFFKEANFRGDRFCVRRGDRLPALPGNFGDNISSIQSYGGARVVVYNDRDFRNGSEEFRGDVRDLRNRRFRDGHTWNDRISSIIVR